MKNLSLIPPYVVQCCRTLHCAGFQAYPVGGCVRDLLLGRPPQDWDIATSAHPHQLRTLFPHTIPTGLAYGTVTVVLDGTPMEVTTFRQESHYHDSRRPDCVRYVCSLEQDLSRRDFTINAMALTMDGQIIDPFHGQDDLHTKQVRCVGDPFLRFREDRLRMFRSIRFAAQLGFQLHNQIIDALSQLGAASHHLPPERIRPEVEKTLCAPSPHWAGQLFSTGLLSAFLSNSVCLDTSSLAQLPPQPLQRWAGLAALLLQQETDPRSLLHGLIPDKALIRPLTQALSLKTPDDARTWRHLLATHGIPTCQALAAMAHIHGNHTSIRQLTQVLVQSPCLDTKGLALSGKDLQNLGLSGSDIGRMQRKLLAHVLDTPEDNTPEVLHHLIFSDMT